MSKKLVLTIPQVKVFSSFCINLAAAWFFTLFVTYDIPSLTMNSALCILMLRFAIDLTAKIPENKYG